MKKFVIAVIFGILLIGLMSFALAERQLATNSGLNDSNQTLEEMHQGMKDDIQQLREDRKDLKGDIRAYLQQRKEIRAEIQGKNITFDKQGDKIRMKMENHSVFTRVNITETTDENNNTILIFQLGNKTKEIKIMPDTASERALERLRLKVCNETNNCTIELKDVGIRNATQLVYELKATKQAKLFWLFNKKMNVSSQVDSETGKIVITKKPWWAFLAKE